MALPRVEREMQAIWEWLPAYADAVVGFSAFVWAVSCPPKGMIARVAATLLLAVLLGVCVQAEIDEYQGNQQQTVARTDEVQRLYRLYAQGQRLFTHAANLDGPPIDRAIEGWEQRVAEYLRSLDLKYGETFRESGGLTRARFAVSPDRQLALQVLAHRLQRLSQIIDERARGG